MNSDLRQLENLVSRARRGDRAAAAALRQRLAPRMVHLVREALSSGQDDFSLDRRILAESRSVLADNPHRSPRDEGLVEEIAQRLCDNVGRVSDPTPALTCCLGDTVRV